MVFCKTIKGGTLFMVFAKPPVHQAIGRRIE